MLQSNGIWAWGFEFRFMGLGFRVMGLEFGVMGLGVRVWSLGVRPGHMPFLKLHDLNCKAQEAKQGELPWKL